MRKIAVLSVCLVLAFCVSFTSSAIASDEEDILKVVETWVEAFNKADFELMSSLFLQSPKTSEFTPNTGYPLLFKGWESMGKRWKSNLETLGEGTVSFSIHSPEVALIGKDAAVLALCHIATYTDPETKEQSVGQLRQTMVLEKVNGKWLIVHHHASNFPIE